jgi:hypothetical protein
VSEVHVDALTSAVLQEGLDDWIALGQLDEAALFFGAPQVTAPRGEQMVPASEIEPVVRTLVGHGWARIGDVYTRGYFVPFDGADEDAIDWLMGVYRTHGSAWPFEAWLELTPSGIDVARSLPRSPYLERDDGM